MPQRIGSSPHPAAVRRWLVILRYVSDHPPAEVTSWAGGEHWVVSFLTNTLSHQLGFDAGVPPEVDYRATAADKITLRGDLLKLVQLGWLVPRDSAYTVSETWRRTNALLNDVCDWHYAQSLRRQEVDATVSITEVQGFVAALRKATVATAVVNGTRDGNRELTCDAETIETLLALGMASAGSPQCWYISERTSAVVVLLAPGGSHPEEATAVMRARLKGLDNWSALWVLSLACRPGGVARGEIDRRFQYGERGPSSHDRVLARLVDGGLLEMGFEGGDVKRYGATETGLALWDALTAAARDRVVRRHIGMWGDRASVLHAVLNATAMPQLVALGDRPLDASGTLTTAVGHITLYLPLEASGVALIEERAPAPADGVRGLRPQVRISLVPSVRELMLTVAGLNGPQAGGSAAHLV